MTNHQDVHLTDEAAQRLAGSLPGGAALDAGATGHAACCARCAALVESHRALAAALDGLCCPDAPEDFTAGVLECIEAAGRERARERWLAGIILGGVTAAALVAFAAAGPGGLGVAVTRWADSLGDAARALRLGREVLPRVFVALRWPLMAATAALAIPLFLTLSRLMPQPATRTT